MAQYTFQPTIKKVPATADEVRVLCITSTLNRYSNVLIAFMYVCMYVCMYAIIRMCEYVHLSYEIHACILTSVI